MRSFFTEFSVAAFEVLFWAFFFTSALLLWASGVGFVVAVFAAPFFHFVGSSGHAFNSVLAVVPLFVTCVLSRMVVNWLSNMPSEAARYYGEKIAARPA